jgi:integrase
VHRRAPDLSENAKNGIKSAISPTFRPVALTVAAFNQRHQREFFGYKDLQSHDLFGPAMAFRVTRTPGWLIPAINGGRPKYLPEDVLAVLNRLRGGEKPDEFKDCFGRGQRPSPKHKPAQESQRAARQPNAPKSPLSPPPMLLPALTITKIRHHGERRWRIIVGKQWVPVLKCKVGSRKLFRSESEAKTFVEAAQLRLAEWAKGNGTFTDAEFTTFRLVLGLVGGDCQKVLAAVQQYIKQDERTLKAKPRLAKVVARHYLMVRNLNGAFRAKSLPTARYEARKFTKQFGQTPIADITRNDLQVWLRKVKLGPKGKKNVLGTVKLIFDHAIKLELRKDNPTAGVELPKIDQAAPGRFSAGQCEQLLLTAVRTRSRFLPALAVGLFSGARPAEITRTGWANVSLAENRINIPGSVGKTHQYRWVRIAPILRQWLEFIGVKKTGWLIPRRDIETYERWRQQLAAAAGMAEDWPHDVLRHTHASFDYAIRGDFKAVADNLGNTPGISRRNYIAPASLKEAKQLLRLTPERILKLIARRRGTRTSLR